METKGFECLYFDEAKKGIFLSLPEIRNLDKDTLARLQDKMDTVVPERSIQGDQLLPAGNQGSKRVFILQGDISAPRGVWGTICPLESADIIAKDFPDAPELKRAIKDVFLVELSAHTL